MMKQSVFICDKQWKIQKILVHSLDIPIQKGYYLTNLICDSNELTNHEDLEAEKQSIVMVKFHDINKKIPVIISTYAENFLIFLVHIENQNDFTQFIESYLYYLSWAEENLHTLYHDDFYQIQQINNQLINSQRALMKSNYQLQKVLKEIRQVNNTIAILERDQLTNLYRASAFYYKAKKKMEEEPEEKFDIIVLDISNFKLVNEIFGRQSGDRLLKNFALFMIGMEDTELGVLARIAADDFYLLMPRKLHFYDKLIREVERFFKNYPLPVHLSAKIGVYKVQNEKISVEQMCDRARLALDSIDKNSDNQIGFYNEKLHESLILEHKILDSVQDALKNHEFKLYLQPKVNMVTGEIIGAEALVRWIHPEFGFIFPNKFIPLLERENMVYDVDKYIWEETCKILKLRKEMGLKSVPISINVSRGDFYEKDLVEVLIHLIQKYDLDTKLLHLEIIERAYVNDSENIFVVLSRLRENGFIVEMDDFGTGESSLAMLAKMPVDYLKLERYFLVLAQDNKRQLEIIRLIINLAKTLEMDVIAEGVETNEQASFLLSMGCQYAQGYLYGRPAPAGEFLKGEKNGKE